MTTTTNQNAWDKIDDRGRSRIRDVVDVIIPSTNEDPTNLHYKRIYGLYSNLVENCTDYYGE